MLGLAGISHNRIDWYQKGIGLHDGLRAVSRPALEAGKDRRVGCGVGVVA